ncbi:hypothetical protein KR074_000085 [Drosophila pseudoananassae]|nr:hypothetical protein KR074_000085 [Drosophila pseudoananassae]
MTKKKAPKKKLEIVFDEKKRREFVTGFRKRKNERRSRAKAQLEKHLKEERKRIRLEVKDGFKHLKKSYEPLRELTEEDKAEDGQPKAQEESYEDEEVQVKIVELTTNDLTAQRNMLGANTAEESEEEEKESESEEDESSQANRIPGMDFDPQSSRKRKPNTQETEEDEEEKPKKKKSDPDIKSKKDIDRLMKTRTLNKMHKSKLFKQKELLDKKNNQKKAKRDRYNTIKSVPKHQRKKLKFGFKKQQTRYHKGRMLNKKELRKKRSGGGD